MHRTLAISALVGSAAAFTAPAVLNRGSSSIMMESQADLAKLAEELNPVVKMWDPMGLADGEFWGTSNEATIGFLRHAEIKHGRAAMMGFVGWCVQSNGVHWPWPSSLNGAGWPESLSPPEQWDALSYDAKGQIIIALGFFEMWGESSNLQKMEGSNHYMRGGKPGRFPTFDQVPHPVPFNLYDPFGLSKGKSEEAKAKGLRAEINNGRLAMLGLFGFMAESKVEGAVPALQSLGAVKPYAGNYMAPFETNFHVFSSGEYLFLQP